MEETMKDYEKELEASFRKISEGDVISGTVIDVNEEEVTLDLKYYTQGIIKAEDMSNDPGFSVLVDVHAGDVIEATVVRMDDGQGNILLSKKEATAVLAWDVLTKYMEEKTDISVKVSETVNAGVVAYVNNDPDVSPYMKVLMVENYNVSYAEKMIPACDISEQISLASKEASGTGNMKYMLNGAVTLGTSDGANVEIHELVGDDNIYIFGEKSEQVIKHYEKADYVSKDYYKKSPVIKAAVDFIVSKEALKVGHKENLERLYKELLNKDWFMTLLDLEDYIKTKDKMMADYEDRDKWRKMMLVNIAKAGFFSSDRTIAEYNRDIWKLK